jgi:hypothetical protein
MPNGFKWGSIFAGAATCFLALLFFGLLEVALISSIYRVDESPGKGAAILWGIYTVLTIILSAFLGARVSSRYAGQTRAGSSMLHGMTMWSVVSFGVFVLGLNFFGALGRTALDKGTDLLAVAGVGAAVSQIRPQINADVSVLKGKITGEAAPAGKGGENVVKQEKGIARKFKRAAKSPSVKAQARGVARGARRVVQAGSWGIFALFLLGLFGAILGSGFEFSGRRRRLRVAEGRAAHGRAA